ncbi:MAG: polysaccharide biosynthesis protein [Clostridia bacterium]|nr:polysaccharide biosynthesis protein [Clostridia bacterium]
MKNDGNKAFVKGAIVLTVGVVIAKALGGIYRIPLTNMLGAYGIGVYQLIFPIYSFIMTLLCVGIPSAISKLVALAGVAKPIMSTNGGMPLDNHSKNAANKAKAESGTEAKAANAAEESVKSAVRGDFYAEKVAQERKILRTSVVLLFAFGLAVSIALYFFAPLLAKLQNCAETEKAYKIIAPSVLLVCISAALKGYFQGRMYMKPSAVAQIAEQVVKLAYGLIAVYLALPDVVKAVYSAVFAITVSEVVAVAVLGLYSYIDYVKQNRRIKAFSPEKLYLNARSPVNEQKNRDIAKKLVIWAVPMTISATMGPLSHIIESFMVQNFLVDATAVYGLWAGPVHSLLSLPPVLIMGICISILPSVTAAAANKDKATLTKQFNTAFKWVAVIGLPSSFALLIFAKPVIGLLYGGLEAAEIEYAAYLLSASAMSVLTASMVFLSVSVFNGLGKMYLPVAIIGGASVLKAVADGLLLTKTDLGMKAIAFTSFVSSAISCCVALVLCVKSAQIKLDFWDGFVKPLSATAVMCLCLTLIAFIKRSNPLTQTETLVAIFLTALVYAVALAIIDRSYVKSLTAGLLKRKNL